MCKHLFCNTLWLTIFLVLLRYFIVTMLWAICLNWNKTSLLLFISTHEILHNETGLDVNIYRYASTTAVTDIAEAYLWFIIVNFIFRKDIVKYLQLSFFVIVVGEELTIFLICRRVIWKKRLRTTDLINVKLSNLRNWPDQTKIGILIALQHGTTQDFEDWVGKTWSYRHGLHVSMVFSWCVNGFKAYFGNRPISCKQTLGQGRTQGGGWG